LLTEIDHVAIAVRDLEAAIAYYRDAFGAEVHHREIVESDGVEEALFKVADSYIQLTEPPVTTRRSRSSSRSVARGSTTSATASTTAPRRWPRWSQPEPRPIDNGPTPGLARHHGGVRAPEGVRSARSSNSSRNDLVESYGGVWTDEDSHHVVGFDLLDSARYIRANSPVDLPPHEIVELMLDGVVARLHRAIPWRPGARELLAELNAAGVPCALVTMSWRRFVDPIVAQLPPESFVAIIAGDDVPDGEGKPKPTPYILGARACGADPRDCVAIEDSPTGTRSAVDAGCHVLGVPNVRDIPEQPGVTLVESLDGIGLADLEAIADASEAAAPAAPERRERRPDRRLAVVGGLLAATAALVLFALTRGDDGPPPLPPGAVAIDVWAPYWTIDDVTPDLERRLESIREVSPFWYSALGATDVRLDPNASVSATDAFIETARDSDALLVPSILDQMPAGGMAGVLADPTTRAQHIATIVEFADRLDADGIDIDYEQFAFADGSATWAATQPNWIAFVRELAEALHDDDRTLAITIPPVYDVTVTGDRGYWVYDHGTIAEYADTIRIMAYDFSTSSPGPIAPLDWVRQAVEGVTLAVPEEHHHKLVLGVPAYGSNWVAATSGTCPTSAAGRTNVTTRSVLELAALRGGVPAYDPVTGEWAFAYTLTVDDGTTSCVQTRQVHWVDAEGIADRVAIARRAGWGGVSLWALGYDDDEAWISLVAASRVPMSAEPPDTTVPSG
jgi:HAD superfamily hydrolase (TIGR01509 family)